ncbi:MAG: hypothetical protein N838_04720 [Thiohalocapsa sp. PB-PSB1]|jgi:hypothetical protein|nr:MAG: hypothetical protein N838_04720 [Thiohalocapsa sp. PB-PSB1]
MTFDKETLQTLLNLPDIAVDRVVLGERKTLRDCMGTKPLIWRLKNLKN